MNTQELARTTFVLNRETHEQLGRVARRFGVSRSTLVRQVLAEPVALMARWVDGLPPEGQPMTEADTTAAVDTMQLDLVDFIDRHSSEIKDLLP